MNHPAENPRPMGLANELWALSFEHWPNIDERDAVAAAGLSLAGWAEGCNDMSIAVIGESCTSALVRGYAQIERHPEDLD